MKQKNLLASLFLIHSQDSCFDLIQAREGAQPVPPTHWDARGVCFLLSAKGGDELTVHEIIYFFNYCGLDWVHRGLEQQ